MCMYIYVWIFLLEFRLGRSFCLNCSLPHMKTIPTEMMKTESFLGVLANIR